MPQKGPALCSQKPQHLLQGNYKVILSTGHTGSCARKRKAQHAYKANLHSHVLAVTCCRSRDARCAGGWLHAVSRNRLSSNSYLYCWLMTFRILICLTAEGPTLGTVTTSANCNERKCRLILHRRWDSSVHLRESGPSSHKTSKIKWSKFLCSIHFYWIQKLQV